VTEALRDSGINVVHHDEIFKPDTPDTEWLAHAGAQGWAVLTKDKRIQYHPLEIAALLAAHVRTFVIATTANLTGEELAALAVKAMPKVRRIIQQTPPPFIAKIYRGGSIKIALKQGKKQHR
jgi:predicted nuclease of predicted toxin-antitoxin system